MKKIKSDKNYDIAISFKVTDRNGTVTNQAVVVDDVNGDDAMRIINRDPSMDGDGFDFPTVLAFAISFCEDNFDCNVGTNDLHFLLHEHGKYPLKKLYHVSVDDIIEWTADESYADRWTIAPSDIGGNYSIEAVGADNNGGGAINTAQMLAVYYGKEVDMRVA